jgi:UDP-N-acetylglucosamine 2-epimerase (non-hydrolysing)
MKLLCVVGARPNLMKMAPIIKALKAVGDSVQFMLVHTGQHYDHAMNHRFFEELGLPWPDVNLEVGSASHPTQIANTMLRFEPIVKQEAPDAIIVVGDVNSTLACSLVANRMGVPVAHVEAGLRSFDREMPEEINRILTDQISDLLFTTERGAEDNLRREGISADKIRFVGNVMIDSLLSHLDKAVPMRDILERNNAPDKFKRGKVGLVTLHRPSNVDVPSVFNGLIHALKTISQRLPLVFPIHPRTVQRLGEAGLKTFHEDGANILLIEPLGYFEMLGAMQDSALVFTDSGGVQEETTALGVPCMTLRNNTERPVTVTHGSNHLIGTDPDKIIASAHALLDTPSSAKRVPELWDGHAAERIVSELLAWLVARKH